MRPCSPVVNGITYLDQERLRAQAAVDHEDQRLRREEERAELARERDANTTAVEVEFSAEDGASALLLLGKIALSYHDQRRVGLCRGLGARGPDFFCHGVFLCLIVFCRLGVIVFGTILMTLVFPLRAMCFMF